LQPVGWIVQYIVVIVIIIVFLVVFNGSSRSCGTIDPFKCRLKCVLFAQLATNWLKPSLAT